jgi:hypothetical protein
MTPLAALIRRVMRQAADEGDALTYAKIADRGHSLNRGEVQRLATKPLKGLVSLEKRRGLALGLRLHPVEVDRAIAEELEFWLDLPTPDYRADPDLTAADRAKIDAYIQGIKEGKGRRQGNG